MPSYSLKAAAARENRSFRASAAADIPSESSHLFSPGDAAGGARVAARGSQRSYGAVSRPSRAPAGETSLIIEARTCSARVSKRERGWHALKHKASLDEPRYSSPARGRALNRRSSQVNTRAELFGATQTTYNSLSTSNHGQESRRRAEQQHFCRRRPRVREGTADERRRPRGRLKPARLTPLVPTQKSSKCSSRSRSSARARARVLLYHGPFLIPAVAVDATSARLLDGVEAGLRRRRGVVPMAACARPGGRVSSLAWRETRTISPRRDHEDAARRRAAASNS